MRRAAYLVRRAVPNIATDYDLVISVPAPVGAPRRGGRKGSGGGGSGGGGLTSLLFGAGGGGGGGKGNGRASAIFQKLVLIRKAQGKLSRPVVAAEISFDHAAMQKATAMARLPHSARPGAGGRSRGGARYPNPRGGRGGRRARKKSPLERRRGGRGHSKFGPPAVILKLDVYEEKLRSILQLELERAGLVPALSSSPTPPSPPPPSAAGGSSSAASAIESGGGGGGGGGGENHGEGRSEGQAEGQAENEGSSSSSSSRSSSDNSSDEDRDEWLDDAVVPIPSLAIEGETEKKEEL